MPDLESPVDGPTAPTVSPFELLSVLWRHKAVVITTVIASVVVAFVLSARSPKEYSASSELLFRDPGFAQALFGNNLFATGQQEPQRTTQTSIDVVGSRNVARRAAVLLGNGEPIDSLLGSITVTPNSDADIATIEAKRSSPQEAAAVANAFAQGYITYRRETDRSTVAQAEALVTQSIKTASPAEQLKLDESLRQLGVLRSLQTGDAELIASAQPNSTPVSPKPKRDAILGFVVGLLLGCGLALVADFVDRRIKTLEDFERVCPDYPLIASVPHTPSGLAIERQLTGPSGEAYRMLREGLRFLDPTGRARCLIITSAEEGEGKSTAAVNLASALAAVGRNVILLEGDMRRPTAAAMLGGRHGVRGLSDMLVSDQPMEDFVVPVKGHPGLKLIPSGTLPPNSADLLSIGRMADVLTFARENADFVVIDSPPLLPVADTRVLLRLAGVDGVIMIGRAGVSRRDRIRAAARVLAQSGQKVFGLVVTDVKLQADSVYYQYGLDESQEPQKRSRSARAKHRGPGRSTSQSTSSKQAPGVRSPS